MPGSSIIISAASALVLIIIALSETIGSAYVCEKASQQLSAVWKMPVTHLAVLIADLATNYLTALTPT